jgi:peptidoglycan/LPS O-acetylase OafA/YrhL
MFRLMFCALLLAALFAPSSAWLSRAFRSRPMAFLGKYSYGLYVYHHFFSYAFERHATEHVLAGLVGSHGLAVLLQAGAGIAVSAAIAWASYELFEKRFLSLKRYWEAPRRHAA